MHWLYTYIIKPSKFVHIRIIFHHLHLRPHLQDLILVAVEQELAHSLLDEDGGLQGGEHVRDAPLHEEASPYELGWANDRNIDGCDDICKGAHGKITLKIPKFQSFVGHSTIWMPLNVHFFLCFPK